MKVAVVTSYPRDPGRVSGGVSGASQYLVDELRRTPGVEPVVVVPQAAAGPTTRETSAGVTVIRLGRLPLWRLLPGTLYDLFVGRRQVQEALAAERPDVAHFQGGAYLAEGYPGAAVLTVHGIVERDAYFDRPWGGLWWLQWLALRLTEGRARRRAGHVILISDYVGRFLPSSPRRAWRIANPIASSFFDVRRDPRPGRVFCCSRLRPLKNLDGLVAAFAEVVRRRPEAELRIAGGGDEAYRAACEEKAAALGLKDKVRFLGNLGVAQIQEELAAAACLVLPSLQENAPLSVAEAMAAGVPVVASKVGGVPEMVEEGVTGLLVEPRDGGALARALLAVLSDGARAAAMGERARALAGERYRPSAVAAQTLRAYREVLADRGEM